MKTVVIPTRVYRVSDFAGVPLHTAMARGGFESEKVTIPPTLNRIK